MLINILIIATCITVMSSLFVLKSKSAGEWSLKAASYGFFLLFVLYWKSGNGKMDNMSIFLLFSAAFCNSFHQFMIKFCWDFIFQYFNKGVKMFTWHDVYYDLEKKVDPGQIVILKKQLFEDIVRYELRINHPIDNGWQYLLNYQVSIAVFSGEIKVTFKRDNKEILLKKDDFIIIKEKEIYKMETVSDTIFKFTCHKQ